MLNDNSITVPRFYEQLNNAGKKLNFTMPSDLKTGSLLRTLAASKPGGRFLDIGTGTGLSLAWIAEGADENSTIISIDNSALYQQVAVDVFSNDKRISLICIDGNEWLSTYPGPQFDMIFADAMPGKFDKLDEALALVKVGGFYLIDDLLPQPNWPAAHPAKVEWLLSTLEQRIDFVKTTLDWSTGLILFTRIK